VGERFGFLKGHGTENDFVLLPDPDGSVHGDLDPALVRCLCDRRAGIGGDGVLRAVRCEAYDDPAAAAARGSAEWFMDYRNSDGSLSQMCGNGIRLFGRYLAEHQGVDTSRPLPVGTRDGVKRLRFEADGQITVDMGRLRLLGETKVSVGSRGWPATRVSVGNPHAVAFVESLADAGTLAEPPSYSTADFPEGVNVEFVVRRGARHLAMRVHERGSGETRSCGTGACAVAAAAAALPGIGAAALPGTGRVAENDVSEGASDATSRHFSGVASSGGEAWRVDVPGGTVTVTLTEQGTALLTGPAVLVAAGEVDRSVIPESGD
jgi:diaminopimelate epimerase